MSKHIKQSCLYNLPSGAAVHPCSLIHKDGTLMWKHALLCSDNISNVPSCESQEQHIIKTAQRLEELNSWVSQELEPWQCFILTPGTHPMIVSLPMVSVYISHMLSTITMISTILYCLISKLTRH